MNLYTRPAIPFNPETCNLATDDSVEEKRKIHELVKEAITKMSFNIKEDGENAVSWGNIGLIIICILILGCC
jgi:hypothetical protein